MRAFLFLCSIAFCSLIFSLEIVSPNELFRFKIPDKAKIESLEEGENVFCIADTPKHAYFGIALTVDEAIQRLITSLGDQEQLYLMLLKDISGEVDFISDLQIRIEETKWSKETINVHFLGFIEGEELTFNIKLLFDHSHLFAFGVASRTQLANEEEHYDALKLMNHFSITAK